MAADTDEMIAALEAEGFSVVRHRDDPDTQLRQFWDSAQSALRIAQDFIASGATLHVTTPFPQLSDEVIIDLLRSSALRQVNAILATAVVVREDAQVRHAAE